MKNLILDINYKYDAFQADWKDKYNTHFECYMGLGLTYFRDTLGFTEEAEIIRQLKSQYIPNEEVQLISMFGEPTRLIVRIY